MDRTGRLRDLATILGAAAVSCLPFLGQLRDVGAHEIRHAEIAREIAERGDFLIPRLLGAPYRDKPPLFDGAAAALYVAAGGPSIGLARLPSAVAAALGAWAVYALGASFGGPWVGRWAALAVLGTQGYARLARTARPDMVFTAAVMLCALGIVRAEESPGAARRLGWIATAGAACGVASLVKGPLPWLFAAALFVVGTGGAKRNLFGLREAVVFALAGAAGFGAWAVPACLRDGGEYLRLFLTQPDLARWTLSATLGRAHWPWMYALVGMLPFTVFAAVVVRDLRRFGGSRPLRMGVALLAVLTVIPKKRAHYSLPAYPFLALATSLAVSRCAGPIERSLFRSLVVFALAGAPLYYGIVLPLTDPPLAPTLAAAERTVGTVRPGEPLLAAPHEVAEALAFAARRADLVAEARPEGVARRLEQIAGPRATVVLPRSAVSSFVPAPPWEVRQSAMFSPEGLEDPWVSLRLERRAVDELAGAGPGGNLLPLVQK